MGKKLAYTVHVRETEPIDSERPEIGTNTLREETFPAGSELPDWALPHVGDHVWEASTDTLPEIAENGQADPVPPGLEGQQPDGDGSEPEQPAGNASLEAWQEFAASRGVDSEGKSRDQLRDELS